MAPPQIATEVITHEPWEFNSRRSVVYSRKAIVAATQPLAVQAGLGILARGGNAADAAVAVAACMNVTEPTSTGIGGDCFCLYYDAKTKSVKGLNGSGRAPAGLTLELVKSKDLTDVIPPTHPFAVTVPGAAAGWIDTVDLFGSGKLTMSDILGPAISLADNGFPVSDVAAHLWGTSEKKLKTGSPNGGELLLNGKAPREGDLMRLPELAETFRQLATVGKSGFYSGRIAESLVEAVQAAGGVLTLEDLKQHTSTPTDPISIDYQGVTVHEHPPNGQGIVALLALGIIDALERKGRIKNLSHLRHNSAEYLHIVIEALRMGFADGQFYVADPDVTSVPVEGLLRKEYLEERALIFDPTKAAVDVKHGSPKHSSDTVYFSVVDEEGNACSFINSLYYSCGTGIVGKGTGVALQSRGSGFSLDPASANVVAPGKRPYHTIIPAMVTMPGTHELLYCYGVMGGFMQPQGHVQVLLNLLHHKMSPQSALDARRICIAPEHGFVFIEEGIDDDVVEQLKYMGHNVKVLSGRERAMFGRGQIIERRLNKIWAGGSDPRGDGCAAPLI
ncbi:hypothetical protein SpCBS45565_g04647 [Spizellomyces sp. 'palustris']|nr:hypothetical protein SpCBS45565_g04647 [Spizellomyces sp. 'palustris']